MLDLTVEEIVDLASDLPEEEQRHWLAAMFGCYERRDPDLWDELQDMMGRLRVAVTRPRRRSVRATALRALTTSFYNYLSCQSGSADCHPFLLR